VVGRQQQWGATVGAAFAGALGCGALAFFGLYALSAIGTAGLLYWLARRVFAVPPSTAPRPRPAPVHWSPYDRRRSGRAPTIRRLASWLRLRRRRAAPPVTAQRDDVRRDDVRRGLRPPDRGTPRPNPYPGWRPGGSR
jgi:hypothetical protein